MGKRENPPCKWHATLASQFFENPSNPDKLGLWQYGASVTSQSGDDCKMSSWVFFCDKVSVVEHHIQVYTPHEYRKSFLLGALLKSSLVIPLQHSWMAMWLSRYFLLLSNCIPTSSCLLSADLVQSYPILLLSNLPYEMAPLNLKSILTMSSGDSIHLLSATRLPYCKLFTNETPSSSTRATDNVMHWHIDRPCQQQCFCDQSTCSA